MIEPDTTQAALPSPAAPPRQRSLFTVPGGNIRLLTLLAFSRWVVYGFMDIALVAVLRQAGASLAQVSMLIGVGFLFAFKFLWAPLVDRHPIGESRYNGWFVVCQLGMAAALAVLFLIDPVAEFYFLFWFLAAASVLATLRDIAMDGMTVHWLSDDERAQASGYMSAGFMVGMVAGGGVMLMLYDRIGWQGSVAALVAATLLPVPFFWFHREPAIPEPAPADRRIWVMLVEFFRHPGHTHWALLVFLTAAAGTMANSLLPVILVDMNWSLARIGLVMNVAGPLASALMSVAAAYVFTRVSRKQALIGTQCLGVAAGAALVPLPLGSYGEFAAVTVVVLSVVAGALAQIASKTTTIDKSAVSVAHMATFMTIQASVTQFAALGLGTLAPLIADAAGYVTVLVISAAFGVVAILGLGLYRHFGPTARA